MQQVRKTRSPQKPPQSHPVSPHPRKPGTVAAKRHAAKNETGHPKARRGVFHSKRETPRRACALGAAFKDARLDTRGTRPGKSGLCGPICRSPGLASFAPGVCRSFLRLSRRPPFRWCPPGLQFPCKPHGKSLQTGQICPSTPRTTPASWCHGSHPNKVPFRLGLKSRIRMSRLRLDKTRFRQAENPAQTTFLQRFTFSRIGLFRFGEILSLRPCDLVFFSSTYMRRAKSYENICGAGPTYMRPSGP